MMTWAETCECGRTPLIFTHLGIQLKNTTYRKYSIEDFSIVLGPMTLEKKT